MTRHVIGVRPSVAVVTVVEVIAVGALILMPLWWAIGSVAATALALSVTVHGSTAPGWVGTLWRWRAARRTPPTVPPAVDITGEGIVRHPFHADGIEMSREHDRRRISRSDSGDEVRPVGSGVGKLDGKTPIRQDVTEGECNVALAGSIS